MEIEKKPRAQAWYENVAQWELIEALQKKNAIEVPKLKEIVCHIRVGSATEKRSNIIGPMAALTILTGQRATGCRAKKSVSGFKLREGIVIGAKVTLRGERMYEFIDICTTQVIPLLRDFQGFSAKSFDGKGNFSLGLPDIFIFPGLNLYSEKFPIIKQGYGLDITIKTTSNSDSEAKALLNSFSWPF